MMSKILPLLCLAMCVHGATYASGPYIPGQQYRAVCENGKRTGDLWQTPGRCDRCTCLATGEILCHTCGTSRARTGLCYRKGTTYPLCCDKLCWGDPGFNMQHFYNNGVQLPSATNQQ